MAIALLSGSALGREEVNMPVRLEASAGLSKATGLLTCRTNPQPLHMHGKLMEMFLISSVWLGLKQRGPEKVLEVNGCAKVGLDSGS